jgi:hypothetical protein
MNALLFDVSSSELTASLFQSVRLHLFLSHRHRFFGQGTR